VALAIAVAQPATAAPRIYKPVYTNPDAIYVDDGATQEKKIPGKFYLGVRGSFSLATFGNKYGVKSDPTYTADDSFLLKPQIGFDISAGYALTPKWRIEMGYWHSGTYGDKDSGMTFDLGQQTLSIGAAYTIKEWTVANVWIGAFAGAGILETKFNAPSNFAPGAKNGKTSLGLTGSVQAGIEEKIADNVWLGISYKFSWLNGHEQNVLLKDGDTFISKTKGVFSNTFGLGVRFAF
jgi:opacity protein-like surface antigen